MVPDPQTAESLPHLVGNAEVISRPLRLNARFFLLRALINVCVEPLTLKRIWYNIPILRKGCGGHEGAPVTPSGMKRTRNHAEEDVRLIVDALKVAV